jgi:hypothetical protein
MAIVSRNKRIYDERVSRPDQQHTHGGDANNAVQKILDEGLQGRQQPQTPENSSEEVVNKDIKCEEDVSIK